MEEYAFCKRTCLCISFSSLLCSMKEKKLQAKVLVKQAVDLKIKHIVGLSKYKQWRRQLWSRQGPENVCQVLGTKMKFEN